MSEKPLIEKVILSSGTKSATFKEGTKVTFHYETKKVGCDKVIDDSRKVNGGKPMELVLGKKFKLEVWEAIIQKMAINEVARFTVDKSLVNQYPFISRTIRDAGKAPEERSPHCCAMTVQNTGVGYDDLNELLHHPTDLQFTIELIKVENPDDYERDTWQLSEDEKIKSVAVLKEKGNSLYQEKKIEEACAQYAKAIGILEQLMLKEKPRDTEWLALREMKLPILLNYAQCKLLQEDYYEVIQHCNEVLEAQPTNVKALFRRARALLEVWEPEEAKSDFIKSAQLDPGLQSIALKYCKEIDQLKKQKDEEDKIKLQKLF
ncbi:AH receptor-interacting protein [Ctenocephalides felis]|uniref:AH receptor-interacting protein n=1 Tax=Ctenocephalides felis TaxID=7515 RepID=UPI000E6E3B3E|nr:AH receptor-interacting protein [Ctenocephalides felis]